MTLKPATIAASNDDNSNDDNSNDNIMMAVIGVAHMFCSFIQRVALRFELLHQVAALTLQLLRC